ncbi:MAG: helix-turn-helix domain-containing protein [Anaerolineales bacterium]|nr:MAG: helix-turn-helix domain-containing protein [Anaerolineales bacterium]
MSGGHRTLTLRIDYKELRKTSPEAARQAVVDYWKKNGHNIAEVARTFGINRCVIYDILRKWTAGDLRDRPKTPHHQPNKRPPQLEDKVIAAKNKTRLGPDRLSRYLQRYEQISVPAGTVRHTLARNKERLTIPAASQWAL